MKICQKNTKFTKKICCWKIAVARMSHDADAGVGEFIRQDTAFQFFDDPNISAGLLY